MSRVRIIVCLGFVALQINALKSTRPSGEIGRHSRLKICRLKKVVPVRFRPRAPKNRNFWSFYSIKVALHPDFVGYPLRIGGQLGGDFLKHQPEYVNDSGS